MQFRNSLIGAAIERREDYRFLRGEGKYVGDLCCDGALHASVLRSSVPHGRIRRIDPSKAISLRGVHAVFVARDIGESVPKIPLRMEPLPEYKAFEQPVIAVGKVRYVGEPLALVVADDPGLAEDALEHIRVDIDELPAVIDPRVALETDVLLFEENGSNRPAILSGIKGDVDAAFARAVYTRKESFKVHRHSAVPLEPRGLLAQWDDSAERLTLFGAAKVPFYNRSTLSKLIGLPEAQILLVENDVGGGFGVRGEFYPEDYLIPFAAMKLRRPVKWSEDRRENLIATNHSREAECELEIACSSDGAILGLRGTTLVNSGAYLRTTGSTPARNIAQVLSGPYRIEHVRSDVSLVVTNKTPSGTYRGPGRFEADFFRERMLDIAARDLHIDPVEFRRRNLVKEDDMPWKLPSVGAIESECDSGDYSTTLDRCLQEFEWEHRSELQGKLIDGKYHGVAVGCYIEGAASGRESVRLKLEADGTVSVYTGSSALGQGLETVFAQIAADALGLPLDRIRGVYHGSTNLVRDGVGAFSSRSVVMGGSALLDAAECLKNAIRGAASERMNCVPDQVVLLDGRARGPNESQLDFAEVSADIPAIDGSFSTPKRTYSYGTHAAHISVDPGTGKIEILQYVAVEDVGRIINPRTLHGQCLGAIVQGLGGTLLEEFAYDDSGQMVSGSLADYLLPTATDFPNIKVVALELKPSPVNPLGAKGAGEGGIIPVGGVIANALAGALSHSITPNELPLSPERVWTMIRMSQAVSGDQG